MVLLSMFYSVVVAIVPVANQLYVPDTRVGINMPPLLLPIVQEPPLKLILSLDSLNVFTPCEFMLPTRLIPSLYIQQKSIDEDTVPEVLMFSSLLITVIELTLDKPVSNVYESYELSTVNEPYLKLLLVTSTVSI